MCRTSSSLLHVLLPGCQGEQVRRGVCYSCLVMSWINGADSNSSLLNKLLWVHQSEGLKASANGNQSRCKWTVLCKLKLSVDGWIRTCKAGLVLVLIGLVKHICCSDFLRCHWLLLSPGIILKPTTLRAISASPHLSGGWRRSPFLNI